MDIRLLAYLMHVWVFSGTRVCQDLVGRTFFELWFEEMAVQHSHLGGDGTHIPPDVVDRTQQIVDVLKKLGNCQPIVTVIKRSLALDFASQSAKTAATISGSQASVRKRCELMCKCLLESILKVDGLTCHNVFFSFVTNLQTLLACKTLCVCLEFCVRSRAKEVVYESCFDRVQF